MVFFDMSFLVLFILELLLVGIRSSLGLMWLLMKLLLMNDQVIPPNSVSQLITSQDFTALGVLSLPTYHSSDLLLALNSKDLLLALNSGMTPGGDWRSI